MKLDRYKAQLLSLLNFLGKFQVAKIYNNIVYSVILLVTLVLYFTEKWEHLFLSCNSNYFSKTGFCFTVLLFYSLLVLVNNLSAGRFLTILNMLIAILNVFFLQLGAKFVKLILSLFSATPALFLKKNFFITIMFNPTPARIENYLIEHFPEYINAIGTNHFSLLKTLAFDIYSWQEQLAFEYTLKINTMQEIVSLKAAQKVVDARLEVMTSTHADIHELIHDNSVSAFLKTIGSFSYEHRYTIITVAALLGIGYLCYHYSIYSSIGALFENQKKNTEALLTLNTQVSTLTQTTQDLVEVNTHLTGPFINSISAVQLNTTSINRLAPIVDNLLHLVARNQQILENIHYLLSTTTRDLVALQKQLDSLKIMTTVFQTSSLNFSQQIAENNTMIIELSRILLDAGVQ